MTTMTSTPSFTVDLTNCDREPIHIPGSVQPHGVILVVQEPALTIAQISENCAEQLGQPAAVLLGQPLAVLVAADWFQHLTQAILPKSLEATPHYLPPTSLPQGSRQAKRFEGIVHRYRGQLILELEELETAGELSQIEMYAALKNALVNLDEAATVREFCCRAAQAVRQFTGFDRVMIYQFLEDDSGHVIAEAAADGLEPYLGLRYPASDIPKQARELYKRSVLRLQKDVNAPNARLIPQLNAQTNAPLDMSYTAIRSMSPIHLEYLRNMGVQASTSFSIVRGDKLWGLIACHHYTGPKYVSHSARMASEFLAHALRLQLGAKEDVEHFSYKEHLSQLQHQFVAKMAKEAVYHHALMRGEPNLLGWLHAGGVAACTDEIELLGDTPDAATVQAIVDWLRATTDEPIYATNQLGFVCPAAAPWQAVASGLLAMRLAKHKPDYFLWFRPEYKHQVHWGGDPNKPVESGPLGDRLTPRKSFALWQEEVTGKAVPWQPHEREAVAALRHAMMEVIVQQIEALMRLNSELSLSNQELDAFAYIASHDLKEPLRGISNYVAFLQEDYAAKLDEAGIEMLQTVARLSERMENLLNTLLDYSHLGRRTLNMRPTDAQQVLTEQLQFLQRRLTEASMTVRIPHPLPTVPSDPVLLGELFVNLLVNAAKYNDKVEKWVEIGVEKWEQEGDTKNRSVPFRPPAPTVFYVRDNGIGIPAPLQSEVFRIFRRLHGREEYGGGVGAGLTIAKRIVERHGGHIWLESILGEGTTFYFTLAE